MHPVNLYPNLDSPVIATPTFIPYNPSHPKINVPSPHLLNRYCPNLLQKISEIAKTVLFAGICLFLYWTNPTLFAIGFIAGIIYDESVQQAIDKIKAYWLTLNWKSSLIGGIASFLSLPVTFAAGSIFLGAYLARISPHEEIETPPLSDEDERLGRPLVGVSG